MLLAVRCPGCGSTGAAPCSECVAAMTRAAPVPRPEYVDRCRALLDYDGPAREVIAQLKYRNVRSPVGWLAEGVASMLVATEVDVVTWAPTTPARRRQRGFDQAELLARRVARLHRLPCRSLLLRAPGAAQTGRDADARHDGPSFTPTRRLVGARVAVIDDVVTTGATFTAAGRALRAAGAEAVVALAAAHPA